MWGAIAVIALGLLTIVVYSFTNDSNKREELKEEIKQEVKEEAKLPVETTPVKDKEHYSKYIDRELLPNHTLGSNKDPYYFEYRFNKHLKDLNIDRLIDFGQIRKGAVRVSAEIDDKIMIFGSMHRDNMKLTDLTLNGFELKTKEDFQEFKELALAFLVPIAEDEANDLYKQLKIDYLLDNVGKYELVVGDIKYAVSHSKFDDGEILINLSITNIKNP